MSELDKTRLVSAIFVTFSGNCRKALTFYQSCFGGKLKFRYLDDPLPGFGERPVIIGSLVSECVTIYGSDLVHQEGRKVGNYVSVFLNCESNHHRNTLLGKLVADTNLPVGEEDLPLIEITDNFDVKWILGVH